MRTYRPHVGSIAHRAIVALQERGEMSSKALGRAVGVYPELLRVSMLYAIEAGAVQKVMHKGRRVAYRMGESGVEPVERRLRRASEADTWAVLGGALRPVSARGAA